jgi:hypothetical protein
MRFFIVNGAVWVSEKLKARAQCSCVLFYVSIALCSTFVQGDILLCYGGVPPSACSTVVLRERLPAQAALHPRIHPRSLHAGRAMHAARHSVDTKSAQFIKINLSL